MAQKSRVRWLQVGDLNTKFFHYVVNANRKRNSLNGLVLNNLWVEEPMIIKEHIKSFFQERFSEEHGMRPRLDGVCFQQLNQEQRQKLSRRFDEDEIRAAVWDCDSDKCPGPDGINFKFIKDFWEVLKNDIVPFVQQFYDNAKLPKGTNSSFISLISKVDNLVKLNEYRPISLVGCMYKILAKTLARRLKVVLPALVDERQMAFMEVLVNGSPTKEFQMQKRIRQGDPLAPLLFVLVAEGLTGLVREATKKNLFSGVVVGSRMVPVDVLQYADDTIFIGEANLDNVKTMKVILRCFELVSGLKVNFAKSSLGGVGVNTEVMISYAEQIHCKLSPIPFQYLGIPIGANPRRCTTWQPVIRKCSKKLSTWRASSLSIAGKVCLINSVLTSLPLYFMSFYTTVFIVVVCFCDSRPILS
uniref:Transposon TX1 uncharacterized n=1 Tax=Cajanus cajan TaxID=3821 RepID=A0A151U052_CAJCA|nr:Transposon TX1 uncharacterized [Cajanus cajan]